MKRRVTLTILFASLFFITRGQQKISLGEVVSLALEKNYDVQIARKVSESASTNDAFAYGAYLPQLNGVATTLWNNNEQELRFQDASRNSSGKAENNNTAASLQLTWTLFDGTRMFATRERISELAEQGELQVKDQMVTTIAQVITNYYDIVRQKQQLKAIIEQMAVGEERVKLAQRKLDVGTGVKPELLQAQVDLNAQRAQLLQQEATISQLKERLNALVGLNLPQPYDVADTILIDLNLEQGEAFANLENTNYQLLAARKNLSISNLSVRERRGEYFPFLDFNAAYNFNRNDNTRLINPFSPVFSQSTGLNYGFTLTVPILNGFNTRRQIQIAKIEFDRQNLLYQQQRNNINVDLRNAFVNYENARKILLIEEETIGAAKENVSIALQTFKAGVTTSVELRIAQQSLAEAYSRLITARYNAKLAETELLRLNGSLLK